MTQIDKHYSTTQTLVEQLFQLYQKVVFTRQDLAKLMDVSLSYVAKSIARGYGVPAYKRLGHKQNSKVIFNINDVAEFLNDTTKTI
ncbi:hypothetical protein GJV85_03460 [Sulfurimonas aquatica]|uniref:Helix-turn-helix domain-containing protein n=1 Tax=Sulfurimonas aquatica TaxID=2672570 RepID=A0A975AZ12_9BACT|nr:hypothetical protein [Sulfurimonas aquatica]QSZ41207.1 hypothetical protein GJV85_03460 [Sulfurimonas aquatica]